jgi:hypothetical protein
MLVADNLGRWGELFPLPKVYSMAKNILLAEIKIFMSRSRQKNVIITSSDEIFSTEIISLRARIRVRDLELEKKGCSASNSIKKSLSDIEQSSPFFVFVCIMSASKLLCNISWC